MTAIKQAVRVGTTCVARWASRMERHERETGRSAGFRAGGEVCRTERGDRAVA